MVKQFVYGFSEGNKSMKEILGGKGANLCEMTSLGLRVPPGFIISTYACQAYYDNGKKILPEIKSEIEEKLRQLENLLGKKLGDEKNPLLVSVRSGAAASMPGMMDTILNLGLNDKSVEALSKSTNNPRFAYDSYRRFIQMFGNVVMGVPHEEFEKALSSIKSEKGLKLDTELNVQDLKKLIEEYKKIILKHSGESFPDNPKKQLYMAIEAVFNSWNNPRAIAYRRINNIKGLIGTAVNIQSMVFGNMGEDSGTGVCFTRNPSTGENEFYGEFLLNAQGEDVVAGIRTPNKIEELSEIMPNAYRELLEIRKILENHYKDVQDIEFTIEKGTLYILQTRNAKRTAQAAVKIAVDMVKEGLISKETAILRVDANSLNQLLHKQISPESKKNLKPLAKGLPASPGAAFGQIVFNAQEAIEESEKANKVILVRLETSPEDIEGMYVAQGILTARGGMTSHAAVVARGMGKCCVAGCSDLFIDEEKKVLRIGNKEFRSGDFITLDGNTGEVFEGKLKMIDPDISGDFATLMSWADEYRKLKVRANAETPNDVKSSLRFGAEGIGLCRTEHMFFEESRIKAVREMILSDTKKEREKALSKILPMQKNDFLEILSLMESKPVTIRLLDPPLHEFLPKEEKEIEELSVEMNLPIEKVKSKINELHEFNPMLGHRGCRLGITYPEITEMQARAIFEASAELINMGKNIIPEIMIPLVGDYRELENQKKIIDQVAFKVMNEKKVKIKYSVGTMIEVPRAAITSDEIAKIADFYSFGTNDLTQMTCGFSRDDSAKFLQEYIRLGIYEKDPFQTIDKKGVGELMKIAIQKAKSVKPNIKMGICGEHGGDPETIEFCYEIGLDYVSCSPFRIPVAKLAAAQSFIKEKRKKEDEFYSRLRERILTSIQRECINNLSIQEISRVLSSEINPERMEFLKSL